MPDPLAHVAGNARRACIEVEVVIECAQLLSDMIQLDARTAADAARKAVHADSVDDVHTVLEPIADAMHQAAIDDATARVAHEIFRKGAS